MEFENMRRQEKLDYIKAGPDKMKKNDKGKTLKAEGIKNRLLDIRNMRLKMTFLDGTDPEGNLTIKQQMDDIKYIDDLSIDFYKQFEDPEPEDITA